MKRGRSLLAAGDIPSARLILTRLADNGEAEASLLLAGTFDPAELAPDVAMEWGTSHHSGMLDIATVLAAPLPWNGGAQVMMRSTPAAAPGWPAPARSHSSLSPAEDHSATRASWV